MCCGMVYRDEYCEEVGVGGVVVGVAAYEVDTDEGFGV